LFALSNSRLAASVMTLRNHADRLGSDRTAASISKATSPTIFSHIINNSDISVGIVVKPYISEMLILPIPIDNSWITWLYCFFYNLSHAITK